MNRILPFILLSSISFSAFAGRGEPVARKRAETKTARAFSPSTASAQPICVLDFESRRACTGADLADAMEVGVIVVPNKRLPRGTYSDDICPENEGMFDREGTFVLADDILFFLDDESSDEPWDLPPEYPGCGGDNSSSSSPTYLACMDNCNDSYNECRTTIHSGGLDPAEQSDMCDEMRQECQDRCSVVYG